MATKWKDPEERIEEIRRQGGTRGTLLTAALFKKAAIVLTGATLLATVLGTQFGTVPLGYVFAPGVFAIYSIYQWGTKAESRLIRSAAVTLSALAAFIIWQVTGLWLAVIGFYSFLMSLGTLQWGYERESLMAVMAGASALTGLGLSAILLTRLPLNSVLILVGGGAAALAPSADDLHYQFGETGLLFYYSVNVVTAAVFVYTGILTVLRGLSIDAAGLATADLLTLVVDAATFLLTGKFMFTGTPPHIVSTPHIVRELLSRCFQAAKRQHMGVGLSAGALGIGAAAVLTVFPVSSLPFGPILRLVLLAVLFAGTVFGGPLTFYHMVHYYLGLYDDMQTKRYSRQGHREAYAEGEA